MKRAKLNNDKITALYCRLSKDDGTNNESMSIGTQKIAKVEHKRKRSNVIDKTFYCCTKYRKFREAIILEQYVTMKRL